MNQAVTVVVTTASPERWPMLVRAVASARSQTVMPAEVVVVVDHDQELFRRVRRDLAGVTVMENSQLRGLPGARNTGAFHAQTSLIAFLDDDTVADPSWLGRVIAPLSDPTAVGAGADITPEWETGRPRWLPQSLLWAAGTADRRNPAGTVLRRDEFRQAGGFARSHDDFSTRLTALSGGHFPYVPEGLVRHLVPARLTFAAYLRRCYTQSSIALTTPHPAAAMLRDLRGGHVLRAGGMLAGAAAAGLGAVAKSLRARRTPHRVPAPAR